MNIAIWRRLRKSDTWHFHPKCRRNVVIAGLPEDRIIVSRAKPSYGEFCNECQAKEKRDAAKS